MPDPPAALIPNSYVSPSLATEVIVRKFADGLPLYRQEQIWKRYGLPLKRNTMANWVITLANHYLRRLWKRIKEELLKQGVIHADETVLQVLKEEGRAPTAQSRMWVYVSGKRAAVQLRIFEYRDNRNGDSAVAFLGDYEKIVVSDGYSGYKKLNKIVRAGCWAHTPGIIKYPFWQMTAKNPNAIYAYINYGDAICPDEINRQSICVNSDIGKVLEALRQ